MSRAARGERAAYTAFASIAPGLEPVLHGELAELGVDGSVEPGGVSFRADDRLLARVHRHSRTAGRVTVEIGSTRATSLDELAKGARGMPWRDYVVPGQRVSVKVTTEQSRLHFPATLAKKLELAIGDALRGPRLPGPRPPHEPARVGCHVTGDRARLSIDASGDRLHRRGWRLSTAKAPLRENLAAAVLRAVGWTPDEPLVDPMCGSGTFPIEAAGIALGHAPGHRGEFAFLRWPRFDRRAWEADARPVARGTAPIVAADRDAGAVRATRENAERARVLGRIVVSQSDAARLEPPVPQAGRGPPNPGRAKGLVVANPPWGERIDDAERAWEALAAMLRGPFAGWRVAVLTGDPRLLRALPRLSPVARFPSGGTRVGLFASA